MPCRYAKPASVLTISTTPMIRCVAVYNADLSHQGTALRRRQSLPLISA